METYELEKQVYNALISNAELITLLPQGALSIFHYVMPSIVNYPTIVYSVLSDVPAMMGDDEEITHKVTIRIHVITKERNTVAEQTKFQTACGLVKGIMKNLGFIRRQTMPYIEEGKAILIFDFSIGVDT